MRGNKAQANAEAQRNLMNQYAGQFNQQAGQIFGMESPALRDMLSGRGYNPQERAAITLASMGGLRSVFDAAAQNATNRAARTRNDAGYNELLDELSRDQARAGAQAAAQNQINFAGEAQRRREAALRALGQTYGIDVNAMTNLLGGAGRVAGDEVSASRRPGFFDSLALSLLGNARYDSPGGGFSI